MFNHDLNRALLLPLCLLATLTSKIVQAQTTPDPHDIIIDSVNYNGNGCPNGSVDYYLSHDGKAFTLTFDNYLVDLEQSPNRSVVAKNCTVRVRMFVPDGWMFSLFGVDFRGFADLGPQTQGVHNADYRIQGSRVVELGKMILEGPRTENYHKSSDIPLTQMQWSDCGRDRMKTIVIDTRVAVKAKGADRPVPNRPDAGVRTAVMTMDTIDGELLHSYGIAWKRCRASGGGSGSRMAGG